MSLDSLEIIIDVVDSFSQEINDLEADLVELKGLAEAVDDINIDVNVYGDGQISRLQAQLMALNAQIAQMRMSGLGGVGGGGGGLSEADRAADSFDITNLRMSDLHNVLAKLVPLLLVYVGALPAAIGGVLALGAAAISAAAALAAIGGLAGIGFAMQQDMGAMDIFERVKEDFIDAFEPLMRELAPMFAEGLNGLEALFDEIASRGDTLLALRDDARAFGSFMLTWIPNVMEAMGMMAEAFSPLFGEIANSLREMEMLRGLTEFMAEAAPAFMSFISSIWSLIKTLTRMSIGFMQVAAGVTAFIDKLITLVTLGGKVSEQLGAGIGLVLSLATAFFIVNGAMKLANAELAIFSGQSIVGAIKGAGGLSAALRGLAGSALSVAGAIRIMKIAIASTLIGLGLIALGEIVGWIAGQFMDASSSIDEATKSLRNFGDVESSMGSFGSGGGSVFYQFNPDSSRTIINAPDAETGKRVSRNQQFSKKQTDDYMASGG